MKLAPAIAIAAFPLLAFGNENQARISHLNAQLLARQSRSASDYQEDPRVARVPEASAVAANTPPKLTTRLTFLTDGQRCVAIPRGSIIHQSEKSRIRGGDVIVGQLVEWQEFLMRNHGEIRLEPVDYKLLQGTAKLSDKVIENATRSAMTTISTHMNRVVALPAQAYPTSPQP